MFTKGCFDRGMICTYKGIFLFREQAKSVIRNYSGGKPNNFKGLTLMRRKNHWPIFKGVNYQIITNSSTTIWVLRKWIVKKCLSQDLWCKVLTFLPTSFSFFAKYSLCFQLHVANFSLRVTQMPASNEDVCFRI